MNKEELKNKYNLTDGQMEQISDEALEKISGGSGEEIVRMALTLWSKHYGSFLSTEEGNVNFFNINKMKTFFAEKGYRYEPATEDGQQDIYWKDGLPYGSDYIIDLIENGQF